MALGEVLPQAAAPAKPAAAGLDATRKVKPTADKAVVDQKRLELAMQAEALFKPAPVTKAAQKAQAIKPDDVPAEPAGDHSGSGDGPVSDRWVEVDGKPLPGRDSGDEAGQGKGSTGSGKAEPQPFGGRFGTIRRDLGAGRSPVKGN